MQSVLDYYPVVAGPGRRAIKKILIITGKKVSVAVLAPPLLPLFHCFKVKLQRGAVGGYAVHGQVKACGAVAAAAIPDGGIRFPSVTLNKTITDVTKALQKIISAEM